MKKDRLYQKVEALLASADVMIDGGRPWDIRVHDNRFFSNLLSGGSLALGQAYVDNMWDCPQLDEFFYHILRVRLDCRVIPLHYYIDAVKTKLLNRQKPINAFRNGEHHYDIGNRLYQLMLDKHMVYSCGYWESACSLDEAQEHKLDLVCRKLQLMPGMRILDIGCGWGGACKFAAENYDVEVVGITVSKEQVALGKEMCLGLPVEIRLQDYREIDGTFDRVFSIGMFEHVGDKNYQVFIQAVRNCLKDDGLFLLHTIGKNEICSCSDPWIDRYIFPGAFIPSVIQISRAIEGDFVLEDWQNFGPDYDRTLMHWYQNFQENWHAIEEDYDERFYRMWTYYLLSCAGSFRARRNQVWQLLLSPDGIPNGYRTDRYETGRLKVEA